MLGKKTQRRVGLYVTEYSIFCVDIDLFVITQGIWTFSRPSGFLQGAEVEGLLSLDCPSHLAMWVHCSKGRARVAKQVLAISLIKCENPK